MSPKLERTGGRSCPLETEFTWRPLQGNFVGFLVRLRRFVVFVLVLLWDFFGSFFGSYLHYDNQST